MPWERGGVYCPLRKKKKSKLEKERETESKKKKKKERKKIVRNSFERRRTARESERARWGKDTKIDKSDAVVCADPGDVTLPERARA